MWHIERERQETTRWKRHGERRQRLATGSREKVIKCKEKEHLEAEEGKVKREYSLLYFNTRLK